MKNLKLLSVLSVIGTALNASAGVDPSSVKIKVYQFLVSTDQYCSNPTSIYQSATPTPIEFVGGANNVGSGLIANGTYPCVIMVISDQVTFTPAASSGSCVAGQAVTLGISHAGGTSQNSDGTTSTAVAGQENKLTVYLSTASTNGTGASQGNSMQPPTAANPNLGVPLNGALVIAGDKTSTFVFGAAGTVDGSQSQCGMNRPTFGFR